MKYKPTQILVPHSPKCRFRDGEFDWTWVLPEYKSYGQIKRDLAGRNNAKAKHPWLKFRCKDPDCPGELIVYLLFVMRHIQEGLK